MNIVHIIPGSGGSFYCGNCLRDSKYVDAIRKLGHQVIKVPMYLPLFADEHDIKDIPVFYGAVSIYLKQLYPIFRRAPRWFDKILNSGPALKLAAGMAGSTRAKGLEEMTVSMLLGEEGKQSEELERMVDWIAINCKPEVIHLSNALLLGLAHRLKEKMNVPVVCSLQDEDVWVDVMKQKARDEVWELMHEKSRYVDAFVAVSNYYASVMKEKMRIPPEKIETLYLGVDPNSYQEVHKLARERNIGFLSRMNYDNGLDILVDAYIILKKQNGFEDVKLIMTGGSTGDDAKFLNSLKKKLKREKLNQHIDFCEDFKCDDRTMFFKRISVLSVPVRLGEAFGLYLLESMASGVPVVQPALGAFPEIVEISGGGIIYEPNTPDKLADALARILNDKDLLAGKSNDGYKGVCEHFDIEIQAKKLVDLYERIKNASQIRKYL
jgi:glycosyltransferase involved in cell wall biosynthesis